jgi:hypothetical protein
MRSKLLTLWAVILMGAFGAFVQGKVAITMGESETSPFAKIYSQAISVQKGSTDEAELRRKAKDLYREGKCLATEDLYRFASVLVRSNDSADLLLAHDCALASLIEGFRPAAKALSASQRQLLLTIGVEKAVRTPNKGDSTIRAIPLIEQFEASWSAAANGVQKSPPGVVALAVAE